MSVESKATFYIVTYLVSLFAIMAIAAYTYASHEPSIGTFETVVLRIWRFFPVTYYGLTFIFLIWDRPFLVRSVHLLCTEEWSTHTADILLYIIVAVLVHEDFVSTLAVSLALVAMLCFVKLFADRDGMTRFARLTSTWSLVPAGQMFFVTHSYIQGLIVLFLPCLFSTLCLVDGDDLLHRGLALH